MNCGTYTECKIKHWVFFENFGFLKRSKIFRFRFFRKCFCFFGVFVKEIVTFDIGFGFCVLNSIWEHGLKIFFDSKNRKNPRSVNKSRTKHLGGYF